MTKMFLFFSFFKTQNGLNYIKLYCYIVEMRIFVENDLEEKVHSGIRTENSRDNSLVG